jgi:hypothetical protein
VHVLGSQIDVPDRLLNILQQDPELIKGSLDALEKIIFTLGRLNNEGKLDSILQVVEEVVDKINSLDDSKRKTLASSISALIDFLASIPALKIDFSSILKEIDTIFLEISRISNETKKGLSLRELLNIVRSVEFARALKVFIYLSSLLARKNY